MSQPLVDPSKRRHLDHIPCAKPVDVACSDNNEESSIRIAVDNIGATVGNNSNAVVGDGSGNGSGDTAVGYDSGDAAVSGDVNESG